MSTDYSAWIIHRSYGPKKSKILIICQKNPFGKVSSKKKIFLTIKNLLFLRKCAKTKIAVLN